MSDGVSDAIRRASEEKRMLMYLLILGSPGLLLVDHIHFQYNGMLLGKPGVDDQNSSNDLSQMTDDHHDKVIQ